jgi:hypothetical protein
MKTGCAFVVLLLAACGTEEASGSGSLTRAPGECSDVEVHVIGVNGESDGSTGSGSGGDTTVILQRPGHHILVLSGYHSISWDVQVSNGALLDGVYAVGYEPQQVRANVRTQIDTESTMEGGAGAWGYEYPAKDTTALLKLTAIRVARHATSFHGCFTAKRWVIGENMAVTSDCTDATSSYQTYDAVLDCDGDNTCGQDGDGDGDAGDGSGDGSLY